MAPTGRGRRPCRRSRRAWHDATGPRACFGNRAPCQQPHDRRHRGARSATARAGSIHIPPSNERNFDMTKLAAVFFTSVLLVLLASPAAAQTGATAVSAIPVNGTFVDRAGGTGTFVGTLAIDRFESRDRALVLV